MKTASWKALLSATAMLLNSGCAFLLPTSQDAAKSKWQSYDEAMSAFDRIIPGATDTNEMAELGFHPAANPNVRLLTYLDVIQLFMPNRSISRNDLDPAVRDFIDSKDEGQAWELLLNRAKEKRRGNAFLDITGFVKESRETRWRFKSIFLVRDGVVVYKLASGVPNIDIEEKKVRPLGPFQELDELIVKSEDRDRERERDRRSR